MSDNALMIKLASRLSASYEEALKYRLASRLRGLVRLAGLALWALLSVAAFHPTLLLCSWTELFIHQLVVKACWALVGLAGLLPLLYRRKQRLSARLIAPLPTSRLSHLSRLIEKSLYGTALAYASSWAILFFVWCRVAQFSAPDASLDVWVHIKVWQINPRFAYLALVSLTAALACAVRHECQAESDVHFPRSSSPNPIPERATAALVERFTKQSVPMLLSLNFGFPVAWLLLRQPILKALVYHTAFRPYFASLYRHANLSSSLLLRAAALTTFIVLSWDFLNVLFDVYMTQPILLSHLAPSSNEVLLKGLQIKNEHRQSLALLELAHIVLHNTDRRQTIFKEVARPGGPKIHDNSFEALTSQLLALLKDAQEIARKRGLVDVPHKPASAVPAAAKPALPSVEVKHSTITRPVKPNFFDRLAKTQTDSPSPSPSPAPSVLQSPATPSTSSLPKVFQTPTTTPQKSASPSPKPTTAPSTRPAVPSLPPSKLVDITQTLLTKAAPEAVRKSSTVSWLVAPLPSSRVQKIIPRPEVSIWVIETLSTLMVASLKEDQFGIAQKSLTKILESFVGYAQVLEGVIKELQSGADEEMETVLRQDVQPLLNTTQDGIRSILKAFQPFMSEFKIAPKTAETLRGYQDWS